MDINKQVLRQINESKSAGNYSTRSFHDNSFNFVNNAGFNNNTFNGGINPAFIGDDSFLKNLNIKNSKAFGKMNNPLPAYTPEIDIKFGIVSNGTRTNKSCNGTFDFDYTKSHFNPNIIDPQQFINYNIGIDSRHSGR